MGRRYDGISKTKNELSPLSKVWERKADIMKVIKPSKKSVGKKSFKVESIKKPKMLPINMGAKNESLEATREAVKAIVDVLVLAQYGSDIRDKKNEAVEQRLYEKASEYRKEELLTDKEIGDKVVVLKKLRKKL